MNDLPNYYTALFNAVTDAIQALDEQNYGEARSILVQGQQAAEEAYLSQSQA